MMLKRNKISEAISSFEQASFTTHTPDGDITVSQEGIADVFANMGKAWTNWRMARINKRPKLSQKDLEKIRTWAFMVQRQVKKTYGERRWVSQKMRTDITEIPFSEYAQIFKFDGKKDLGTFSDVFDSTISATNEIFEMYSYVEKYMEMISTEIKGSWTATQAYESISKTVGLIGSPRELIEKHLKSLPTLPGNKVTGIVKDRSGDLFSIYTGTETVPEMGPLRPMDETEMVGFSSRINKLIDALCDNNYFDKEVFFTPEYFAETIHYETADAYVHDNSAVRMYYDILKIAYRERNQNVIEALSPDFWNFALTNVSAEMAALNLEILSCGVEYMNRHLK